MRTGAAEAHRGYFHETAFYDSDDEFVEIVAPFLHGGIEAGEPTIVACAPHNTALLRRAIDGEGVRFLHGAEHYGRPGPTIREYRTMFARLVAEGAQQIRVVGDVPHPGVAIGWEGWARYEAAVNHAYDDFPLWGLCPYDTRITPPEVLDDVAHTHPFIADRSGHHPNDRYEDPATFLSGRPAAAPDPLQARVPDVVLVDPTPAQAREALLAAGVATVIGRGGADDLSLVTSEAVTNAMTHGSGRITVRIWRGPDRIVMSVSDEGSGPTDPLAGLLPPSPALVSGRGLWIANQLSSDVSLSRDEGFELRVTFTALERAIA